MAITSNSRRWGESIRADVVFAGLGEGCCASAERRDGTSMGPAGLFRSVLSAKESGTAGAMRLGAPWNGRQPSWLRGLDWLRRLDK